MARKSKAWLIVPALILIVIGISMSGGSLLGNFATYSGTKTCEDLQNMMTHGAGEGECFVLMQENKPQLAYITSTQESSRSVPVTYANPTGKESFCSIDYCTSCIANILTCDSATSSGGDVTVCNTDSDCGSQRCVEGICKEGLPSSCSGSETRCAYNDDTAYQICLPSGSFSGKLPCPSGKTCYSAVGQCMSASEVSASGTGLGNTLGQIIPGVDNSILLIIVGILMLVLAIL